MTSRLDLVDAELSDLAARRIQAGEWPWSFFCYPEEQPRPVFPSSFFLLAPGDGSLGLAVRCPACQKTSVNLVSHQHVDLPFHNDPEVGVVEHVFSDDVARTLEEFRAELYSGLVRHPAPGALERHRPGIPGIPTDRGDRMYGLTRATTTLIAAAGAGLLIWFATQVNA